MSAGCWKGGASDRAGRDLTAPAATPRPRPRQRRTREQHEGRRLSGRDLAALMVRAELLGVRQGLHHPAQGTIEAVGRILVVGLAELTDVRELSVSVPAG